jgi:hypothetical protein
MKRKSRNGAEGTNLTSLSSMYIFFIATRPMAELVATHPQHFPPIRPKRHSFPAWQLFLALTAPVVRDKL